MLVVAGRAQEGWQWIQVETATALHQEKIHLLENGLKVLKMAF